ncbi:hypothetical protein [Gloeothece verrucosa]|uniref:DUF5678 domain-containing protein n=1 Tax=Gloeothece verrucosa (strain PCC 7822) TaxID=497965 RepID=E0UFE6_GLOV7|nr:hypothetical protein [Gloeothece verrucosa]ADN16640.1 hypothetical protein Cyan7822_4736 [Gloeothece verrucosa PCC 7822]
METDQVKPNAAQILTLEEIIRYYPDQWVLIADPELDQDLEVIRGEVVAHSLDRDELYNQLGASKGKSFAIEYTGSTADDVVVLI